MHVKHSEQQEDEQANKVGSADDLTLTPSCFLVVFLAFFSAAKSLLVVRALFFDWACTSLFGSCTISTSLSSRVSLMASKLVDQMVSGTVALSFLSSSFFSAFFLQSSSACSNTRLCVEDGGRRGVVCQKLKINNNKSRPRRYFDLTQIFVPSKCS